MAEQVYRVISAKLRVQRGPGREDLVAARPVALTAKGAVKRDRHGNAAYLDSDEAPTLVTFDEHCRVNIAQLLRIGAIAEWTPAAPASEKAPRSRLGRAEAPSAPSGDAQGDSGASDGEEAIRG